MNTENDNARLLFFRNINDVLSDQGIEIDAGSLWKKLDGKLVLIDEDQHITHQQTADFVLD